MPQFSVLQSSWWCLTLGDIQVVKQQLLQAQQDLSQLLESFFVVSTAAIPFSLTNCLSCSSLNARKTKTISILTLEQCFSFSSLTWASEKVSTDFPRSLLRNQSRTVHGKQCLCCLLLFALEGRSRVEKGIRYPHVATELLDSPLENS